MWCEVCVCLIPFVMIYQLDRILKDVRICIDENVSSNALADIGDVDTLSQDEIIRSKVVEAVERVHTTAPAYLIESGHNFGDEVYWREMESGWVLLPEDFMRLVVFEMDDWSEAVYQAIGPDSVEYKKQRSRFKGIRGTAERPVCVIAIRPEGRVLEFYSCKSTDAKVSRAVYVPYPKIDEEGGIDISERCYRAVVYVAAALTLAAEGEDARSQSLMARAQALLEV